jgi:copper chaperone CopZ
MLHLITGKKSACFQLQVTILSPILVIFKIFRVSGCRWARKSCFPCGRSGCMFGLAMKIPSPALPRGLAILLALGAAACSKSATDQPVARAETFTVPGMHCASCVSKMRVKLRAVPGVAASRFDIAATQVTVELSDPSVTRQALAAALTAAGFPPAVPGAAPPAGPGDATAAPASPAPSVSPPAVDPGS